MLKLCGIKSQVEGLSKRPLIVLFVCHFLYILTLSHHCVFRPMQWMVFLFRIYLALSWRKLKRLRSGTDLMLHSSRLVGFGPLRVQGTMTTSLLEWNHAGCVTHRPYCVTGHTPPQILWEKNRTLLLLVICNGLLRWNSCSFQFWCQYCDCSWHLGICRSQKGHSLDVLYTFMKCTGFGIMDQIVYASRGCFYRMFFSYPVCPSSAFYIIFSLCEKKISIFLYWMIMIKAVSVPNLIFHCVCMYHIMDRLCFDLCHYQSIFPFLSLFHVPFFLISILLGISSITSTSRQM